MSGILMACWGCAAGGISGCSHCTISALRREHACSLEFNDPCKGREWQSGSHVQVGWKLILRAYQFSFPALLGPGLRPAWGCPAAQLLTISAVRDCCNSHNCMPRERRFERGIISSFLRNMPGLAYQGLHIELVMIHSCTLKGFHAQAA